MCSARSATARSATDHHRDALPGCLRALTAQLSLAPSASLHPALLSYANGFYSLIHFGVSADYLATLSSSFDYSYPNIVTEMCLWLTGQPSLDLIQPLTPNVQLGASVLFWSFIVTSYFVLLNLLIAIFNTT